MKICVARQPIYNRSNRVCAYELLYRSNSEINAFDPSMDGDRATRLLIANTFTEFGLSSLTGGHPAFINFTKNLMKNGVVRLLDPKLVVIEILEDVMPTTEMVEIVEELKADGYRFALDDYTGNHVFDEALPLLQICKVDFMQVQNPIERKELAYKLKSLGIEPLAEKVETKEDYEQAEQFGYSYYQGYYFLRPVIFSKNSCGLLTGPYVRALRELSMPVSNYDKLTELIMSDASLSYKMLHRINTLQYYRSHRVTKLRDALIRMGMLEIKRWLTLILLNGAVPDEQKDILRLALIRGVFIEKLIKNWKIIIDNEDAFFTGMFSVVDKLFEGDMNVLLEDISISDEVKSALQGEESVLKELLDFVIVYEKSERRDHWTFLPNDISYDEVSDLYLEAVIYGDQAYSENAVL